MRAVGARRVMSASNKQCASKCGSPNHGTVWRYSIQPQHTIMELPHRAPSRTPLRVSGTFPRRCSKLPARLIVASPQPAIRSCPEDAAVSPRPQRKKAAQDQQCHCLASTRKLAIPRKDGDLSITEACYGTLKPNATVVIPELNYSYSKKSLPKSYVGVLDK